VPDNGYLIRIAVSGTAKSTFAVLHKDEQCIDTHFFNKQNTQIKSRSLTLGYLLRISLDTFFS